MNAPVPPPEATFLRIERLFDASRELVWAAWTLPEMLSQWWGPVPHPSVVVDMDVRTGGHWRNCLRSVDTGEDLWQNGIFTEVTPPERLVFSFVWEEDGERGMETEVVVTFETVGAQTRLTLTQTPFRSEASRDGHGFGWNSSFDRLETLIGRSR